MSKDNIEKIIVAEKTKLEKLEEKQNEILKKIKTCKSNIEKYTLMKNNQQFTELSRKLEKKGLTMEDILEAVTSGNLNSLQDKIKNPSDN